MAHKGFNISSIRTKLLILQFIVTATSLSLQLCWYFNTRAR